MSRAPINHIPDLVARVLAAVEGLNNAAAGRSVGVHGSYIGEWRRGQVPRSLQEQTRLKLMAFIERTSADRRDTPGRTAVVREVPATPTRGNARDAAIFAAGEFKALEEMAQSLAATAAAARVRVLSAINPPQGKSA